MKEFNLNGKEFVQLCDLLKVVGLAQSGGQAKLMISDGIVSVDGQVELRKRCKIRVGQLIELDGHSLKVVE